MRLSGRASSSSSCGLLGVPSAELAAAVEGVEEAVASATASSRGEVESGQQPVQQQDQVQDLQQQERQEQLQQDMLSEQQPISSSTGVGVDVAAAAGAAVRQVADGSLDADEVDVVDVTESDSSIAISDMSPSQQQQQQHSSPQQQQQQLAVMPSLPEVDFIERIGRGSFGEVYRGVWCGSVVAVKVIRVRQQPPASRNRAPGSPTTAVATTPPGILFNSGGSCSSNSSSSSGGQQHSEVDAADQEPDEHEQQVAMELAQHEYESWLNANLRHPNIVQLFTSFTVVLEDRMPQLLMPSAAAAGSGAGLVHEGAGWAAGLSWKTHLVMEFCELGTMQVGKISNFSVRRLAYGCSNNEQHVAVPISAARSGSALSMR
jgi:hypothetical protein